MGNLEAMINDDNLLTPWLAPADQPDALSQGLGGVPTGAQEKQPARACERPTVNHQGGAKVRYPQAFADPLKKSPRTVIGRATSSGRALAMNDRLPSTYPN